MELAHQARRSWHWPQNPVPSTGWAATIRFQPHCRACRFRRLSMRSLRFSIYLPESSGATDTGSDRVRPRGSIRGLSQRTGASTLGREKLLRTALSRHALVPQFRSASDLVTAKLVAAKAGSAEAFATTLARIEARTGASGVEPTPQSGKTDGSGHLVGLKLFRLGKVQRGRKIPRNAIHSRIAAEQAGSRNARS